VIALNLPIGLDSAIAEGSEALCAHCGEPVPAGASGPGPLFCCGGCAGAYHIIRGLGLDRYYVWRAKTGERGPRPDGAAPIDVAAFAHAGDNGRISLDLMVDGLTCAACVWLIESALEREPGLKVGRVSIGSRRLHLEWTGPVTQGNRYVALVEKLGYRLVPFDAAALARADDATGRQLLRALAVAGFASANVMLFSVSLWSGVEMGPMTRDLLHWFSALIALPAIAYAGQPFFRSAWAALRAGRANMDVPVSLGVILVAGMSTVETMRGETDAYFDGAIMLLFFLLIGRFLDHRVRGAARSSLQGLLALRSRAVMVIQPDGSLEARRPEQVQPGAEVHVAAGERVGVDGVVLHGVSELDMSLVTGESLPVAVAPGQAVFAGTVNLGQPLTIRTVATGESTLLAEIGRLMEAAESRRGRFVALADRVARYYAPVVGSVALATLMAWRFMLHASWQAALTHAVAVLIVTCPCALGLAVPAVQVVTSGWLMRRGILIKDATALDRLAEVDTVVFDKTGTLTEGRPELSAADSIDSTSLAEGASLAQASRHPLAVALVRAACDRGVSFAAAEHATEIPGRGIAAGERRLGSRGFCGVCDPTPAVGPELWFMKPGGPAVRFAFADRLRTDARAVIDGLKREGLEILLRSGDNAAAVDAVADALQIADRRSAQSPADKVATLERLRSGGCRVLMVGDGLNDAPALAAADVSISPTSAADLSQNAADVVFQGSALAPVRLVLHCARRARRIQRENIALALAYNLLVVPLAVMGLVTPLVAAVAMSSSSLVVVLNSLRAGGKSA
jgi:Cu2+-exporting ATPase